MEDKAREARNEYMREWRARNKDRTKKIQERYWEKRARKEEKKLS